MRRLAALNLAQRIVVVVALGAGLHTLWAYLACRPAEGGWFNYTPLTAQTDAYVVGGGSGVGPLLWAIVAIAVWAGASLWLLGLPSSDPPD